MPRLRVLMVTGVYEPETSGASLQCRQLMASLRHEVDFEVLTTSADPTLSRQAVVEGVPVRRIFVDPARPVSKAAAFPAFTRAFLASGRRADIVHFHGFSQKTIQLMALATLFGKRTVLKLTSVGHDDALTMRRRGGWAYRSYRSVDRAIAVSPRLAEAWREAGLEPSRLTLIPNAVNTERFRSAAAGERASLKHRLGWPADQPAVLFVGFFSHEKRPDVLYDAWASLWRDGIRSTLVLVGTTRSRYHEIDSAMADRLRADAARRGLVEQLFFVERAADIADVYRAADVFALPTTREGLPNVLLEAMASGVPPVISNLPGITDWIVDDGVTGRLVPPLDGAALTRALGDLLGNARAREEMGMRARAHVERHFAPAAAADRTLALYRELLHDRRAVPA